MNREEKITKKIREYWFKDHKAELIECGDITIVNWKKPNSGSYYVRYIFDGHRMYISGDIGEAVFNLTWRATLKSFYDLYIEYFLSKMVTCSNGRYEYDSDQAKERLLEWKSELLEEKEFDSEEEKEDFIETIDEIIDSASDCNSSEEWAWQYVNGEFNDFISENETDYGEWMYEAGDVTPYQNYAFLIGLKMAYEQLKENN